MTKPGRLFIKNIGLHKVVRPYMSAVAYLKCRKVQKVANLVTRESATKALMNGGRNYNGPKVAKLLVG